MSNEKKYPINGFAPGNYWCVCGGCKEGFTGDKRSARCEPCALKYIEPVKDNKQLPPELVEKMISNISGGLILEKTSVNIAEQCAQIAVDYSTEKYIDLSNQNIKLSTKNRILERQRDELVEFIRNAMETTSDFIFFDEAEQLLKKHEDGKE